MIAEKGRAFQVARLQPDQMDRLSRGLSRDAACTAVSRALRNRDLPFLVSGAGQFPQVPSYLSTGKRIADICLCPIPSGRGGNAGPFLEAA
jgi:hypothetical protein